MKINDFASGPPFHPNDAGDKVAVMRFPPPLDQTPTRELELLETFIENVEFSKGEKIFHVGDPADGCYIIDEGTVHRKR